MYRNYETSKEEKMYRNYETSREEKCTETTKRVSKKKMYRNYEHHNHAQLKRWRKFVTKSYALQSERSRMKMYVESDSRTRVRFSAL